MGEQGGEITGFASCTAAGDGAGLLMTQRFYMNREVRPRFPAVRREFQAVKVNRSTPQLRGRWANTSTPAWHPLIRARF